MEFRFSKRTEGLKPSMIREILKYSSVPGMISLAAGSPPSEALPSKELGEIAAKILTENPAQALQYSVTEGYSPLRELTAKRLREKKGIGRETDGLIITSGAQQVMELTAKALLDSGDTILTEDPSFIGSLNAFRSYGVNLRGVPLCEDGVDLEALQIELKRGKVKIFYCIPNFQNPTGRVTSLEKRTKLLELAREYDFVIIEDDPYGDTRFSGEPLPSIKSLDTEGRVVYAGSYSKVISPGLRVGYCCADQRLITRMTVCKQVSDVHTAMLSQLMVYGFLTQYDFDAHLERLRAVYKSKAEIMTAVLDRFLPEGMSYEKIEGGLFIWCKMPEWVNSADFCTELVKKNVAAVPGAAFLADESRVSRFVRLNFTAPGDDDLRKGTDIFCREAAKFLAKE